VNAIQNKRFLIVNPFGIGDVLFTTPLIEAIKAQSPGNYIGYLSNIRTVPFFLSHEKVDKAFIFEKDEYRSLWKISKAKFIRKLFGLLNDIKKEGFDTVFDLSMAREYGLFLKLAGIRERIGYSYRRRGLFLTKKIDLEKGFCDKHMVEYYLSLLSLAGIRQPERPCLKIYISEAEKKKADNLLLGSGIGWNNKFIAVSPGGGKSWGGTSFRKQWPKEYFLKAIKGILKRTDFKIVLLGNDTDKAVCDYIKERETSCINLCDKTGLLSLAAILKRSVLLITNDGGPLHIGVGVGAKTVSIFGPVDENVYGPYPLSAEHKVVKNDDLKCRPCYRNFKVPVCEDRKCLENISPETVVKEAMRILKR
jgi:lipopolysaccharide heptosyltransferase II